MRVGRLFEREGLFDVNLELAGFDQCYQPLQADLVWLYGKARKPPASAAGLLRQPVVEPVDDRQQKSTRPKGP